MREQAITRALKSEYNDMTASKLPSRFKTLVDDIRKEEAAENSARRAASRKSGKR